MSTIQPAPPHSGQDDSPQSISEEYRNAIRALAAKMMHAKGPKFMCGGSPVSGLREASLFPSCWEKENELATPTASATPSVAEVRVARIRKRRSAFVKAKRAIHKTIIAGKGQAKLRAKERVRRQSV